MTLFSSRDFLLRNRYELINEPRYPGDRSGNRLVEWVKTMANHAKGHDWNHLLTTGSEVGLLLLPAGGVRNDELIYVGAGLFWCKHA